MNQPMPVGNGQRMTIVRKDGQPAVVTNVEGQQVMTELAGDATVVQLLAHAATPPQKMMEVILKALGPAEAEIEFIEKITIREG